ncbi:chemotaxis-specific protein-glutamate methyltransferase CheB [Candidatus Viridilinea mediisalina]|uniref:Protein-glutamate methylesterase/protein-glutamine glutaminase n=1 Tax=Candidatus Viridilinea mediisalina TaxID=2024553 RepID=A0A2A6RNY0_9CHLR|nr:chemotaxis-specific protein-glutamate methyltransferase CheB [Candidatus Viridilinea mediisalina]PDW04601.1 chemotaxis response regulator protein-glutamate methylesterase [Candidatus Viridilinea mediisalina]
MDQQRPIRVLVVEDSPAQCELIVSLLQRAGGFEVVGTADNGSTAVRVTETLRPSVVAMDIHMPVMDGYEATRQIMQRCPTPIVMFSNSAGDADRRSMQALAAGALAVVRKPGSLLTATSGEERDTFLRMLRLMAGVRVVTRHAPRPPVVIAPQLRVNGVGAPEILAVASSTGGPAALQALFAGLGANFPLPIVVAQHIARGFTGALVDWLDTVVPLRTAILTGETRLLPGWIYFPPDDAHLEVVGRQFARPRPNRPDDRYCPSADVLFGSVAHAYGARAIGVILTGMGDDGSIGLLHLRQAGAPTLGQDEATCVVFGMPHAAQAAGAVVQMLPLGGLAGAVLTTISNNRNEKIENRK